MEASSTTPGSSNAQNPGTRHTVFLSHSGIDKDFVGILAEELHMRSYKPFFDVESLPKGNRVSMDGILELAKTCKLGVIVLSDDFFSRTKNPMLELATFVKHSIPLLPLFFKLTVGDLKNQGKRAAWMGKWKKWSTTDTRINIFDWVSALDALTQTTGKEYHHVASPSFTQYARLAAAEVCRLLPPDICPSDEHVQGKERLCQQVKDMFAKAPEVRGAKVLALWGMAGVGKSTLCITLHKYYQAKFAGRVCYVEFGRNQNSLQLENIKTVCLRLTNANNHFVETHIRNVGEGIAYLDDHLPRSKKFLLILDNVHEYSLDEARKLILDRKSYPRGSHLLFLGRSHNALARLLPTIDNVRMIHIFPRLSFEEAKIIFLNKTLFLHRNESDIEQHQKDYDAIFKQCIDLCRVSRAGCGSSHDSYNPAMLGSLASYLRQWNIIKWKRILSKLEKDPNDAMENMFMLLRESFDALNLPERYLFLDLALYTLAGKDVEKLRFELGEAHVDKCLRNLRGISFLSEDYGVLDVHRDFARDLVNQSDELFYVQRLSNLSSLRSRLFEKQSRGLTKLAFVKCRFVGGDHLDLSDKGHIRVLLLDSVEGLASLNLGSNNLDRMEINSTCALHVEVASAISLTVCTVSQYSRLPAVDFKELVILELQGRDNTPWKVDAAGLGEGDSLKYVQLDNIELTNSNVLELSCWPSLEELKLSNLPQATMLSGLQNLTALRKFALAACNQLSELQLPASLRHCSIEKCEGLIQIEFVGVPPSIDDEEMTADQPKFLVIGCINLREIIAPKELLVVMPEISLWNKHFYNHEE